MKKKRLKHIGWADGWWAKGGPFINISGVNIKIFGRKFECEEYHRDIAVKVYAEVEE